MSNHQGVNMVKRKQAKPRRHYTYERLRFETPKKQYVTLVSVEYATSPLYRRLGIGYVGILTPAVLREPLRRYVD